METKNSQCLFLLILLMMSDCVNRDDVY